MVKELSATPIPPKIIVDIHHLQKDIHKLVTIIASDGSIKGRHGREVAAAAVAFGHGSPLNNSK